MGTIVGAFIDVLNQRMHLKYFHIDGKCVHILHYGQINTYFLIIQKGKNPSLVTIQSTVKMAKITSQIF